MPDQSHDIADQLAELRGLIGDFQFSSVVYIGDTAGGDLSGLYPGPRVDYTGMVRRAPAARTPLAGTEGLLVVQNNRYVKASVSDVGGGGGSDGFWEFLGGGSPELTPDSTTTATMEDFFIRMPIDAGGGLGPYTQFEMFDDGGGPSSAFVIIDSGGSINTSAQYDWNMNAKRQVSVSIAFSGGDNFDVDTFSPSQHNDANLFSWARGDGGAWEAGHILDAIGGNIGDGDHPGEGFVLAYGTGGLGTVELLAYQLESPNNTAEIDITVENLGGTVDSHIDFDADRLHIKRALPSSDPGTPGDLYESGGAVMISL